MLKMSHQDEALLNEVLRILKNPPPMSTVKKQENDKIIRQYEDLLSVSSAYSQRKREQAQAIVESKRKADPTYATPRYRKTT